MRLLIENKADLNIVNIYNHTALVVSIFKGNHKTVESLNEMIFEKNLHILFLGFDKIAELLIQSGADVHIVGQNGNTALIWAIYKGRK